MENYHAQGFIIQNLIKRIPDKQIPQFGNSGPAFIDCRDGDEQPPLAGYWNNEEEIAYG